MALNEKHEPTIGELSARIEELERRLSRKRGLRRTLVGRVAIVLSLVLALTFDPPLTSLAGASPPVSFWTLLGNSVTSGQFLGTTNNQPLIMKTNGVTAMSLAPGSGSTPGNVSVAGKLNAIGGLQENGTDLSGKYAQRDGSNATGTWPIAITGNATGFSGALSGDVTGTQGATRLSGLQGKTLSASSPTSGQVLTYDGTKWVPANPPAAAPAYNPLQVALLKWYGASTVATFNLNLNGNGFCCPWDVAFDGSHMWISGGAGGNVTELDASDGSIVRTVTAGNGCEGLAFDGSHIWVANFGDNNVTELNASDGSVVRTATVGINPEGVAFDGSHIWVANEGDNSVSELNASDGSPVRTVPVGSDPRRLAFDGSHVWVTNFQGSSVTELNASDGSTIRTVSVGSQPYGVAFDGNHIWVSNSGSNSITEISAGDGSIVRTVTVGATPSGVGFDGSHIWVTNFNGASVDELDISDGSIVRTVAVGNLPRGVAFDGSSVWVANEGAGTVSKL